MSWTNGQVLTLQGKNNKEVRCLIQDGHISVVSDGAVLCPQGMKILAQHLLDGADALTAD